MSTVQTVDRAGARHADVDRVRAAKRAQTTVTDWFFVQEIVVEERTALERDGRDPDAPGGAAELLCRVARRMPLSLVDGAAIAGSQDCAFSPSYALINPAFRVETFAGYCDPTAIYADIHPGDAPGLTRERIDRVRAYWEGTRYVKDLQAIYARTGAETKEVAYFVEPVTGHTIPDMRPYLEHGIDAMRLRAEENGTAYGRAMARSLEAATILAARYRELALAEASAATDEADARRLEAMADVLSRVPARGAHTLHEAVQSFALLWQVMVLEQAPNPYAFSVGSLDRILAPYYDPARESRDEAVALVRHLLTFFQVGNRCWAISQNVMVGGRDSDGRDLTSEMTQVCLDAFFMSSDPQPALSVKVHARTPEEVYRALGRFFFTPGHSTPSLFNDDVVFELLGRQGVAREDLPDYSIAGCQEPLIMGKSSLNTTNTWLNLAKVLELALNDGRSLISGEKLGPDWSELQYAGRDDVYARLEEAFFATLDRVLPRMRDAGNACTRLLGECKPVPFTSSVMDGFATWRDMRDPEAPGARYTGSGCLIHGMAVVADSLHAVRRALETGAFDAEAIERALRREFEGDEELRAFLSRQDKFGNDAEAVDAVAVRLVEEVSARVSRLENPAGDAYLPDWSTPSTHLLYGYWVGATPDGRGAREMLSYGLDPRVGMMANGFPGRLMSAWKLPYLSTRGGYASHVGVSLSGAPAGDLETRGLWMRDEVIEPLFRLRDGATVAPYYVYFNVDDADHLRRVLADPATHAPGGVYIMRIHGTFVNFLDLSPAIQEDIIRRLDLARGAA